MRISIFIALLLLQSCLLEEKSDPKSKKSELAILSEQIKNDPNNLDFLMQRISYNQSNNRWSSVLFDAKRCMSLDSLNSYHHFLVAQAYFEVSKIDHSKTDFPNLSLFHLKKAIQYDNTNYQAYSLQGELFLIFGKYKKAIDSFNQSLTLSYNQEKTHLLMGFTFKQLSQHDEAVTCFNNALSINPDFVEAYIQLGQLYHTKMDTLAVIYYDNAISIDPDNIMTLYNKALFFQHYQDYNKAILSYSELFKVDPFHADGHYNLGFIHMELGLYDVAANNFADAIYSNPNFYEAFYSRGNCFETLGNIRQAESDYKEAIKIKDDYTYAIEALEDLQKKNKKYK